MAIKIFKDRYNAYDHYKEEMKNMKEYSHSRVAELLKDLEYRGMYLLIYPPAEGCLQTFFEIQQPKYPAIHCWREFTQLLQALDHIHQGSEGYYAIIST